VALTEASIGGKRLNAGEPGQEWLDGPTTAKKQRVEVSSNPVFAAASQNRRLPHIDVCGVIYVNIAPRQRAMNTLRPYLNSAFSGDFRFLLCRGGR
jgi:hypothetical protein